MNRQGSAALHERLLFDAGSGEVRDGPRRYVLLRTDVLMGAFDRLPSAQRLLALQALGESVEANGGDSVRAYLAEEGADRLLATMEQASPSLGWGRWRFHATTDTLELQVRNSPFAAATTLRDQPACHAIVGMLRAVASALWMQDARVRELRCACQAPDHELCQFEARRDFASGSP
jgi:uncharacterized protein